MYTLTGIFNFEDLGIRHAIRGYRIDDLEKILENLVFKHLQRNNYQVFVGTPGENKIILIKKGKTNFSVSMGSIINTEFRFDNDVING